ncbi:LAQU0S02e05292g1_1 [Lachancea quebecensis]|uniref:LAQU0S02e05292g1_1 n=1 Tax=Lachancea quebecensis TaxID=1654605 RepID=A0A0P1KMW3_9SACH|nr:LAQU0S02e05292g1_1 [Lachancea quebecensis]
MQNGENLLTFDTVSVSFKDAISKLLRRGSNEKLKALNGSSLLSITDKIYYYETTRKLTKSKMYAPAVAEGATQDMVSRKKSKTFRLLSQEEVVIKIWHVVVEELDKSVDGIVSELAEKLTLESDLKAAFVRYWPSLCAGQFEIHVTLLAEALRFFAEDFPFIFNAFPGVHTIKEFADYRLAESVLSVLGKEAENALSEALREIRKKQCNCSEKGIQIAASQSGTEIEYLKNFIKTVGKCHLRFTQYKRSLRVVYLDNLELVLSETNIEIDHCYLQNIKNFIIREDVIASLVSKNIHLETKKIILNRFLFSAGVLEDLLEIYALQRGFIHEFKMIKLAYNSDNRCNEFYASFANVIKKQFGISFQRHRTLDEILTFACSLYGLEDDKVPQLVKKGLELAVGGELKLIEPLVKSLDTKVKGCYRKLKEPQAANFQQAKNDYEIVLSLWRILETFDLLEPFFKLYMEKNLFRRIIIMGTDYLEYMNHPENLEKRFFDLLEARQSPWELVVQLKALRSNLIGTKKLLQDFQTSKLQHLQLAPMIFERKNVPASFHDFTLPELKIPKSLEALWQEFCAFYAESDPRSNKKLLVLQNMLHHLEVQTDFKLEDGSFLVLELTLLQASILDLFNEHEELTNQDIESHLCVATDILEPAMASFVNAGLLNIDSGAFSVNKEFKPDVKKIKGGLLKIFQKSTPKSSLKPLEGGLEKKDAFWIKEVLRARIVGVLKASNVSLSYEQLKNAVEAECSGFSMGEFKTALAACEDFFSLNKEMYRYKP